MRALALWLAAGLSFAQSAEPPKIVGETKVPRDTLVKLSVAGISPKAGLIWKIHPKANVSKADAPRGKLQWVASPGTYTVTLLVVSLSADGVVEVEEDEVTVTVGSGTTPPVDPPTVPTTGLYFLVVRQDGPAAPSFTAAMGLPAWKELQVKGHSVRDASISQAAALGIIVQPAALPCVVTLQVVKLPDGTEKSIAVRAAVSLPTTGAGVLDLLKAVQP